MKVEYTVANTFIQFAAPRSSSLEEFVQPRSAFSCPASRMVSLEEDPAEAAVVGNVPSFQWPATRGASLDDEEQAAKFAIEMNSALSNALNTQVSVAEEVSRPPRWCSIEDEDDLSFMNMAVKEQKEEVMAIPTFQWPATRGPSLDECVQPPAQPPMFLNLGSLNTQPFPAAEGNAIPQMFMPVDDSLPIKTFINEQGESDASTTVSADEDQSLTTPPSGFSDDEAELPLPDTSAKLKISLTDTLGLWSVGSAAHDSGTCKPCAFLWKDLKKPGCQNGMECVFCHLCPPGEVKRRKKEKMFMRKVARNLQYADRYSHQYSDQHSDQMSMGFDQFEPQYQNQYPAACGMW
jgi:hypothetical protein